MPGYKAHLSIGTVVIAISMFLIHTFQERIPFISTELHGIEWIMLVVITALYSLAPDIDSDSSVINKIWNTTAGLVGLYCLYTGQYKLFGLFAIASIVALEWVKHRGICHNEIFIIILAAPLAIINPLFFVVGTVAGLSHIVADGELFR